MNASTLYTRAPTSVNHLRAQKRKAYSRQVVSSEVDNLWIREATVVGQQLRALREAKDWSREKLAGEARVSLSTIARCENEDRVPNGRNLVAIADALGVTLDELFGRTSRVVSKRAASSTGGSPRADQRKPAAA